LRMRASGPDHPLTLAAMGNLANVYMMSGRAEEALALHLKTLNVERRVLGPGHVEAALTASNAVESLLWLRRFAEAEPLAREAFGGKGAGSGADHPSTVEAMTDLGVVLACLERRDEAEKLLDEALELRPRLAGTGRPVGDATVGMARL